MTRVVLRGARVWDGLADEAREATVAVDGGVIEAVGPDAGGGGDTYDLSGCTIVPGLIEGHAHLCFNAAANWRQVYDSESPYRMGLRMAGTALEMARAGITTVRDLGAPTPLAVEVRDALRDGLVEGPDLLVAGAPITTTGGHCYFMGGEADGELGLRVAVREHHRAGVDLVKVMATGGNMTPGTNFMAAQYTVRELSAVVEEARRLGLTVAAHCHGQEGIERATEAGVDTLEHCSFQTRQGSARNDKVLAAITARGCIASPTIGAMFASLRGTDRFARRAEVVRGYFEHGCKVLMSTDCGIPGVPHAALAQGIALTAEMGGLSPVEALRLATGATASLLGLADRGVIAEGKRADLLAVDGDPLTDLAALEQVRLVVAGGGVLAERPRSAAATPGSSGQPPLAG